MLIYAGIDEAGYGPMLGPLCIGATVFRVRDHDPEAGAPDLWRLLRGAVCRKRSDRRRRIAVDDSKKLKAVESAKTHPLQYLERGVLAFCGAMILLLGIVPHNVFIILGEIDVLDLAKQAAASLGR